MCMTIMLGLLLTVACLVLPGCATSGAPSAYGGNFADSDAVRNRQPARKGLRAAERMLDAGNPYSAITRLHHTIATYPETEAGIDARFVLGRTYYDVNSLVQAHDLLSAYLERAPKGQYAAEARELITRLQEDMQKRYPTPEATESRAQMLRAEIATGNAAMETHTALADLLWKQSRYEESARTYVQATQQFPSLVSDALLTRRVEIADDGSYTVLTPGEIMRRDREANPLRIFNVTAFPAGRDRRTLAYRRYVVAGQVTNQGSSVLRNAEVHVTLFGFGNVIYDTRTQQFGTLRPGQVRAFSLRFSNFDDLNRIERYDTVGSYDR